MEPAGALQVDLRAFDRFVRQWDAATLKNLENAIRIEDYRLVGVLRSEFAKGVAPDRSPLTKELAKTHRQEHKALLWLGHRIGYRVEVSGEGIWSAVGPLAFRRVLTARGFRMHADPKSLPLVSLASGGAHVVTREAQRWAIYKLRKRWGEPVARPDEKSLLDAAARGGKGWRKKRAAGPKWKPIPKGYIPKLGRSLVWPKRDWVTGLVDKERPRILDNIGRNFRMKMAGLRVVSQ